MSSRIYFRVRVYHNTRDNKIEISANKLSSSTLNSISLPLNYVKFGDWEEVEDIDEIEERERVLEQDFEPLMENRYYEIKNRWYPFDQTAVYGRNGTTYFYNFSLILTRKEYAEMARENLIFYFIVLVRDRAFDALYLFNNYDHAQCKFLRLTGYELEYWNNHPNIQDRGLMQATSLFSTKLGLDLSLSLLDTHGFRFLKLSTNDTNYCALIINYKRQHIFKKL